MCSFDTVLVILKRKNLSQRALASYLNVGETAVAAWKAGRSDGWLKRLPEIAAFLGVTVDQLLGASTLAAIPFTFQQKKVIELLTRLDEVDVIRVQGMIELMLTDKKYNAPPSEGAS